MALHFAIEEYEARKQRLLDKMASEKLDAMLLFAQESMYWLTGYDTFGFVFFQCMVVKADGEIALLTRSADLRQAQHTSTVENIVIWSDRGGAEPADQLKDLLSDMGLLGAKLGVEYDTQGLTAKNGKAVDAALSTFAQLSDASHVVHGLRTVKSKAELAYVRKSAALADEALDAAISLPKKGADEGKILAAMQSAVFEGGGDYAGNEFVIGSGNDALLCRYKSGRRKLSANDQLTLEWAGAYARYHTAMMRTIIIGKPTQRHEDLFAACSDALTAVRAAMVPGNTFCDVFDAHAKVMDKAGLARHRLNACGYGLGAKYNPCWMDGPMFYADNKHIIEENMVLFAHMIIMDSDTQTAMTLGESFITGPKAPKRLSKHALEMIVR